MDLGDVYYVLIKDFKLIVLAKTREVKIVSIVDKKKKNVAGQFYWDLMNYLRIIKEIWRYNME